MKSDENLFEKFNSWLQNSLTLKLVIIVFLGLILLIPATMIQSIMEERAQNNEKAIEEVSAKWAGDQQLNGPILTVPVLYDFERNGSFIEEIRNWYLLPENLAVEGTIHPEELKRGIYKVIVYRSSHRATGYFSMSKPPDTKNLKEILYDQAFLTIGITDLRGIENPIQFNWGGRNLQAVPGSRIQDIVYSGVTLELTKSALSENADMPFEFQLDLRGSSNLSFVPSGSTTKVVLKSPWKSPSFNGNFLPASREVTREGFEASWSVLQLNRNFPQSWMANSQTPKMDEAKFGVDLIFSLGDYQKSVRSVKYAAMIIALTFMTFFLSEIRLKQKIHPLQYAMVGLALCLYYSLLISIAEYTGFDLAYCISTLGIVVMIAGYSSSIFADQKQAIILAGALLGIYGFLYIILQLADYALLLGTIGITVILAGIMYFTRNIDWYSMKIVKT